MSAALRLTILVDNRGGCGLVEEHGFAVGLELPGRRILFDTGKGEGLIPNAAGLGWDLAGIDDLVLSHGHYDHTGSLAEVLALNPNCRVYAHPGAGIARYSVKAGEAPRDISITADNAAALRALSPSRLRPVAEPVWLTPQLGLTGEIPRRHPLEDTGGPFFLDPHGKDSDLLEDDLALWFDSGDGLVILTGCCHAGVINTVEQIRSLSGVERVRALIGGLHLVNASAERLAATCAALRSWQPEWLAPCHCTGEAAAARLRDEFGDRVIDGRAGLVVELVDGRLVANL